LWDAHNIRLTARDNDTLLSITNEKGTTIVKDKNLNNITFKDYVLGYCTLGKYLIVFSMNYLDRTCYIDRVKFNNGSFVKTTLYSGNLNFDPDHPI
jgi:hypothetical protein